MSKLDYIYGYYIDSDAHDKARFTQDIKDMMSEIVEDVWVEKVKSEKRQGGYERGSRLVKRLLKKAINEL